MNNPELLGQGRTYMYMSMHGINVSGSESDWICLSTRADLISHLISVRIINNTIRYLDTDPILTPNIKSKMAEIHFISSIDCNIFSHCN